MGTSADVSETEGLRLGEQDDAVRWWGLRAWAHLAVRDIALSSSPETWEVVRPPSQSSERGPPGGR